MFLQTIVKQIHDYNEIMKIAFTRKTPSFWRCAQYICLNPWKTHMLSLPPPFPLFYFLYYCEPSRDQPSNGWRMSWNETLWLDYPYLLLSAENLNIKTCILFINIFFPSTLELFLIDCYRNLYSRINVNWCLDTL